jgi:membrane protease YdiL (CAAX protease family)
MKRIILVGLLTVHSVWLLGLVPVTRLGLTGPFVGIAHHAISSLSTLLLMAIICPKALTLLRFHYEARKIKVMFLISAILILPVILKSNIFAFPIMNVLIVLLFAFSIGLNEELLSRGLILEVLKPIGILKAIVLSSLHFGLLHLSNYYAGQAFGVTVAQIIGASAFGFMCGAIVIYTQSIWIPVLIHTFTNLPMLFQPAAEFQQRVTGSPDWLGTFAISFIYVSIGSMVLLRSSEAGTARLLKIGTRAGLISVSGE